MIAVRDLALKQGAFALHGVSLRVPTGSYGVLMGKTGSGKTTILEAVAGLRRVVAGEIELDGQTVTDRTPAARGIGYVPQDAALFPTMTVREQLAFALLVRGHGRGEANDRAEQLARWLEITPLLDRFPKGLSGGEAQRVALGRALSFRPRFLLMDEPLSSLDEATREQLIGVLNDIRKRGNVTVLHVTHSRHEADRLADVRLMLEGGQVREAA